MAIYVEVERPVAARSPERAKVGEVIRTQRQKLGVSQEVMARRVVLTLAGYRPWEYGERDLKSEDLPVWAEALEMTRAELASKLGLADVSIQTIYGAEAAELIESLTDPEQADEVMQAVRHIVRAVAQREPRPTRT